MDLMANFVVQSANYKDMVKYAELCEDLGFTEIYFQRLQNWGTFADFSAEAVHLPSHPHHADFLTYLTHLSLKNNKVNLTNLTDLLDN